MPNQKKVDANAPAKNTVVKKTNSKTSSAASKQPTANEMREWFEKNKNSLQRYEEATDAIKSLRDIQKSTRYTTISNYSKEDVKTYIKNISSNEKNLRSLSRYLYYRSEIYYRLCKYYANQIDLTIRNVVPPFEIAGDNDPQSILQKYQETVNVVDTLGLNYEFRKAASITMREDVFYGCSYYTEDEGMFVLPLDPDYMKVAGIFPDGSFACAMDMSYFRSHSELLEYWGEPFQSMWNIYQSTNEKYQILPEEYNVCLKFRSEDWETVVPVLTPVFLSLIDLMDASDYQAVQQAANIYKLVWLEMKTMGKDVDDWEVNPDIMIKYFNRMLEEALPPYISAAIVPGELHEISFPDDATGDVTKVEKATKEILNTAGGAQILNLNSASNSTAFKYGVLADSTFSISTLIPQIQAIVNRLLSHWLSEPCRIKFFDVSIYQKDDFKKSILESCQNGLPNKILYNTLNGISEKDTLAMNFLEESCLNLSEKLKPFNTSYTQSGNSQSGGQEKDQSELSDEGLKTRDQDKNNK
nr:MAG TPA: portal protein [Caudoviricetes sp.]